MSLVLYSASVHRPKLCRSVCFWLLSAVCSLCVSRVPLCSASVIQTINGTVYPFYLCSQLTFGVFCWTKLQTDASSLIGFSYSYSNPVVGGYIAVGFSPGQMVGSSAVIGWNTNNGGFIDNFDLTNQIENYPGATTLQLTNKSVYTNSQTGETTLLFVRPMIIPGNAVVSISEDDCNTIIESHGQPPSSSDTVQYHGPNNHAINSVCLMSGVTATDEADPLLGWKQTHATLMTSAFGLIFPLGILVARFGKKYGPQWFDYHRGFVLLGLGMIVAGFIIAIQVIGTNTYTTHKGVGCYVVSAMLFQPINGLLRPHKGVGKKQSVARLAWLFIHKWNARLAYVLSIVNIYIGFSILAPSSIYLALFSALWGMVMAVAITLQLWVYIHGSLGSKSPQTEQPTQMQIVFHSNANAKQELDPPPSAQVTPL